MPLTSWPWRVSCSYLTEYGNRLERTTKFKAVLAGSIELDVTSDEADFAAELGRIAMEPSTSGAAPTTPMRMAAYEVMAHPVVGAPSEAGAEESALGTRWRRTSREGAAPAEAEPEQLEEQAAMQRLAALVERMHEMASAPQPPPLHPPDACPSGALSLPWPSHPFLPLPPPPSRPRRRNGSAASRPRRSESAKCGSR